MGQNLQRREVDSARLDSWKEIAAFFNRDTRTVRRWESDRNLPVHRVPGGERSGVFAYVSELEEWLRAPNSYSAKDSRHSKSPRIVPVAKPMPAESVAANPGSETEAPAAEPVAPAAEGASVPTAESASASESEESVDLAVDSPPAVVSPLSALHSLNTFEGTFTAVRESDFVPRSASQSTSDGPGLHVSLPAVPDSPARIPRRMREALLIVFAAAIGVGIVFLHYNRPRSSTQSVHTPSPEAHDLYLRGRYDWNLRTEDGLVRAIDLFTQSIVHDPQYAAAYAGLADSYLLLRQYGHMPDSEAYARALAAAQQAIALDDSSPDAHRSLAFVLFFWKWDMPAAEKEYRRAIALNPADSQSHHWYATALLSSGRAKEALAEIDIARALEPQSISVLADRGIILSAVDPQAGVAALEQLEKQDPIFLSPHVYLADIYLRELAYDKFLAESRSVAELRNDSSALAIFDRAQKTLIVQGSGPMLRQLARDLAPLADHGSTAYTVARLYSLAGEPEQALRYLRLSYDRRESYILNIDREANLSSLRSLPEFESLVKRTSESAGGDATVARSVPTAF